MARDNILVGMEIGTSKVCVAVGEARSDGVLKILGVGQSRSAGVRKGEIVDFEHALTSVREAVADAESKSNVEVRNVILGITGAHIQSFNSRGLIELPEAGEEITEEDIEDVKESAIDAELPEPNTFLHNILQHYYVDGQDGVLTPLGMLGHKLEAEYHNVHGSINRIQNCIRCVKESEIVVEDAVLNALASALVVLDPDDKKFGALVVDIGGGTTDYIVYVDGVVKQSGVLALGGDHITNDISMGLRVPLALADRLKLEEVNLTLGECLPGETIQIAEAATFAGLEIEREKLNMIAHARMRETFEMLRRRLDKEPYLKYLGAGIFLTGGCSLLKGIDSLAEEIFEMPAHLVHARAVAGATSIFMNPQYSTAIGLVRYAQARQMKNFQPGLWDRLVGFSTRLFGRGRSRSHTSETSTS